jgi:predicted aspartyl protease
MVIRGAKAVGRFAVEFEVANHDDMVRARLGVLPEEQVRRVRLRGVVDPGATRLVLPKKVVDRLGLRSAEKVKVRCADGRGGTRDLVEGVFAEVQGRHRVFSAIVEPKRTSALIGAIVLEDLDFMVDCTQQKLVPRDPKYVVSEIE